MDMMSTQAVLVGTGDLDTDSARVTATVARSDVEDAIRADEPAELYLDVMRPGSADAEPEERTIGVLWENDDLQRLRHVG